MAAGSRQSVRPAMDISATETQQSTSWEKFLMPGPSIIASLGDLVSISAYGKEDFSINKIPQEGGCQYLKFPESFRKSVMQVCNIGWNVFNTAQTNMDQVRLLSSTIPQKIKTAVQILSQAAKVVKVLLPQHLKSIMSAAEDCTQLAQKTQREFSNVIPTIQELYEACQRAKRGYEESQTSDCDAVVKVLSNALDALRRVLEDWKTMGCFFQKICEMIDTCTKFMREFNDKFQSVQKGEASMSEVLDCMNRSANKALNIAQLVHTVSDLYTELSSQHLMDQISSLGRLLTMDPTDPEFAGLSKKVGQGWKEAREAISARVTERQKELDMTEL